MSADVFFSFNYGSLLNGTTLGENIMNIPVIFNSKHGQTWEEEPMSCFSKYSSKTDCYKAVNLR